MYPIFNLNIGEYIMILQDKKLTGQIIKKHRKKKKLTQEELSELIGISEKHLGQIERGAFLPNINNFFKIIEILDINLCEFGINTNNQINKKREELIQNIYSLNDKEIDLCIALIQAVKENNKKTKT